MSFRNLECNNNITNSLKLQIKLQIKLQNDIPGNNNLFNLQFCLKTNTKLQKNSTITTFHYMNPFIFRALTYS